MKIALPVNEKSTKTILSASFGKAPYILFYDTITKDTYFLDNSSVASQGGGGVRVSQVIADHGVKALLTLRCGESAEKELSKDEFLIYKAIPGTVQQNIEAFTSEQLILLSDFHSGFHSNEINEQNIQ